MSLWLALTPEFQLSVVLISSPLAMIVALWGMTSERTLQAMRCSGRQVAQVGDGVTLHALHGREVK